MQSTRPFTLLLALAACFPVACGGSPKKEPRPPAPGTSVGAAPPPAFSAAQEPAPLALRTGALRASEEPEREFRVVAYLEAGGYEIVKLEAATGTWLAGGVALGEANGTVAPGFAFLEPTQAGSVLWVRRPKAAEPVRGVVYEPASRTARSGPVSPGKRIPFHAGAGGALRKEPQLAREWATAASVAVSQGMDPFSSFAGARLREAYLGGAGTGRPGAPRSGAVTPDLVRAMNLFLGRTSIQEALMTHVGLSLRSASAAKPTIPIGKLRPPALPEHPWSTLAKGLSAPAPEERLARAVPAEFYYVRARDFSKLLDLVDVVDGWGEAAADLLDGRAVERGTLARYQTELALERTSLARALGPAVIEDVAIVGSDPYVHDGTDVTLIFRPKSAPLLRAALSGLAVRVGEAHGGLVETSFVHEGTTIVVKRSRDGRVRRHEATVDGLEVVSNSPAAIRRVVSAALGKRGRLSDEPDFLYMLARDAKTADDVLAYMGDAFVAAVVGPAQRVASLRRQLALADLSVPGYAALLFGLLEGRSPKSSAELVRSKLLDRRELAHAAGGPIDWQPGAAAKSGWGATDALVPILDRPAVERASAAEQEAYDSFARGYESAWGGGALDPIALRLTVKPEGGRTALSVDLRELPLQDRKYTELVETAGSVALAAPRLPEGLRLIVGVGKDADLRRELTRTSRSFAGMSPLRFDWLGDFVFAGVTDRNEVTNALATLFGDEFGVELAAPPRRDRELEAVVDLPVYAGVEIRSRAGAALALGLLRKISEDSAGDVAKWARAAPYRGNDITRVSVEERRSVFSIYYAILDRAIVVSLNESAMHGAIDQLLDAPPEAPAEPARKADPDLAQVFLDLAGKPEGAIHRLASWVATAAMVDAAQRSSAIAGAVFAGAPEVRGDPAKAEALMKAYFGVVPRTPDGRRYAFVPEGLSDPLRGTPSSPAWPALPVEGSPVSRVVSQLASLRTALRFDEEPGSRANGGPVLRSLHAAVQIDLVRPPAEPR